MMLADAAYLSQIVSAFLVAASLIFVGLQLRQNTKAVKASMSQAHATIYHETISHVIADSEFARLWKAGLADPAKLSEVEQVRFVAYTSALFRFYEASFVQWRRGLLDDEHWKTIEEQAKSLFGQPGVKFWWGLRRQWHSAAFRSWLEALAPLPPEALYGTTGRQP